MEQEQTQFVSFEFLKGCNPETKNLINRLKNLILNSKNQTAYLFSREYNPDKPRSPHIPCPSIDKLVSNLNPNIKSEKEIIDIISNLRAEFAIIRKHIRQLRKYKPPPNIIIDQFSRKGLFHHDIFNQIIINCIDTKDIAYARKMPEIMKIHRINPTIKSYSRLLELCAVCKNIPIAHELLNQMENIDNIKLNDAMCRILLELYSSCEDPNTEQFALRIFEVMKKHNLYDAYKGLINFYSRKNNINAIKNLFDEMKNKNIPRNKDFYNMLFDLYKKSGDEKDIEDLIVSAKKDNILLDINIYNKIIAFYHEHGIKDIEKLLRQMEEENITPNSRTYVELAFYYHKNKNQQLAEDYCSKAIEKNSNEPFMFYLSARFKILNGKFQEAKNILEKYADLLPKIDKGIACLVASICRQDETLFEKIYNKAPDKIKEEMLNINTQVSSRLESLQNVYKRSNF